MKIALNLQKSLFTQKLLVICVTHSVECSKVTVGNDGNKFLIPIPMKQFPLPSRSRTKPGQFPFSRDSSGKMGNRRLAVVGLGQRSTETNWRKKQKRRL